MKRQLRKIKCVVLVLLGLAARPAEAYHMRQSLTIKPGWNAVHFDVAPTQSADELFADWPTDSVGVYDPASFLVTKQFNAGWTDDGTARTFMHMWNRTHPDASVVVAVPAGSVCVFFATNSSPVTKEITGVPRAQRITWHKSADSAENYMGFSLQPGKSVKAAAYLDGFEDNPGATVYYLSGKDPNVPPTAVKAPAARTFANGDVVLVPSTAAGDWSGALYVSPMNGIDLDESASYGVVSVRNDGASERTIAFKLPPPVTPEGWENLSREWLHWRDNRDAYTNGNWNVCNVDGDNTVAVKKVASGETWTIQLGVDRSRFNRKERGVSYGALIAFEDVDGGTMMRSTIPFSVVSDGKLNGSVLWSTGLWLAEVAFSQASATPVDGKAGAYYEAGGVFRTRFLMHIDGGGNAKLLQRVVIAGENDENGNFTYKVYSGNAVLPTETKNGMRISSAALPTEKPVIDAVKESTQVADGKFAFDFIVAEHGATSILRHPYHPQHDGMKWDFVTKTPSGDNYQNYVSTVKPELFSVTNSIVLEIPNINGAGWSPNNSLEGACEWTFSGLRHEGPLKIKGVMSVRRIADTEKIIDK